MRRRILKVLLFPAVPQETINGTMMMMMRCFFRLANSKRVHERASGWRCDGGSGEGGGGA